MKYIMDYANNGEIKLKLKGMTNIGLIWAIIDNMDTKIQKPLLSKSDQSIFVNVSFDEKYVIKTKFHEVIL